MYQPPQFQEDRLEVMHDLIRAHPFAALVALESGALSANHLPFVLHHDFSEKGTLQGHVARANPFWKNFNTSVEALAIFQGAQHYITPSYYPSKKEHGKVVPTWNYVVVHAYGHLKIIEDPAWLRTHLDELTAQQENKRADPWAVSDAPDEYTAKMLKGIVGFEIPISHIEGKWKASQNKSDQDKLGVARGLMTESDAMEMSRLVQGEIKGE